MRELWTLSVKLEWCGIVQTISQYHLCEFPATRIGRQARLNIAATTLQPNASWWVFCPSGHVAHTFVACLGRRTCWAKDHVAYGSTRDSWDIPSYPTCPAPLSPLPPSYACATGGDRVSYTFVCDHRKDCSDNSDENFCHHPACGGSSPLRCGDITQVRYGQC